MDLIKFEYDFHRSMIYLLKDAYKRAWTGYNMGNKCL
jgi:hypothetical protein